MGETRVIETHERWRLRNEWSVKQLDGFGLVRIYEAL